MSHQVLHRKADGTRERQSLHFKRCEVCHRLRHRDEAILVDLTRSRHPGSPNRTVWMCAGCVEDLRDAFFAVRALGQRLK